MPSSRSHDSVPLETHAVETVPVLSESVSIERRSVDTGGVRLRKQVHEEQVRIEEPLRKESVSVRRVAIGRAVDTAPPVRHEGDTTIYPVVEERLITQRQLFLVEEVHLRKSTQVECAPQTVTLRHESVQVERQDSSDGPWRREEPDGSSDAPAAVPAGPAHD